MALRLVKYRIRFHGVVFDYAQNNLPVPYLQVGTWRQTHKYADT